ncbi:acyl carrier protein [Streptomyces sp. NPDC050504]|uniref:acyl carrier protein n=1 Tax=Streptomyces sp. NPDC050504 TaxID=3365618 RepID=UPI0037B2BC13
MYDVLKGILVEELQLSESDVLPTASRAEVGLDSVAMVELATLLTDRLGFDVQDYELLEAATVADLARLLEERAADAVPRTGPAAAGPA